jgi:predicted DNA-binding transcriptional regulator AlpA
MLFWTIKDVSDVTKLSETTIRRKVKDHSFPSPFKITGRKTVWKPDDVRGWADQVTKKDGKSEEKSASWLSRFA